ncbi:MAG: alpha/beta hydrolase [Chloroflexi bacterium]|nr:alpha/beta hydrolase [Chloroflexota bacterium]
MVRWTQKKLLGFSIKALLVLCASYFMWRWFEHHQVYFPSAGLQANGDALGRPWAEAYFDAKDGVKLHGWFFPTDTNSARRHLAVLLCHGNAGNISHRLDQYEVLLEAGVNVFAFDYRGYGRSAGRPGEEGTYLDAEAAHAWLCRKGFGPTNIVALGDSLGGGVVVELARRAVLGGLILQSTFTSIPDIGAELFPFLPLRWLCTIRYDSLSKLPTLKIPILVLHSRGDTLVRFRHGERLFAAANEPKMFWELAGDHNDTIETGRSRYLEGLNQFLATMPLNTQSGRVESK